MPVVIILAAVGLVNLAICVRRKENWQTPLIIILALAAMLIIDQIKWQLVLIQCGLVSDGTVAVAISVLFKALPLLWLAKILYSLIGDTTTGARAAAKVSLIVLTIVALPPVCLPARAHGRPLEISHVLDHPGQQISQLIKLNARDLKGRDWRSMYLLVDADGVRSLKDLQVNINGFAVKPLYIPGISMVSDFASLKRESGNIFYWEGENEWSCLTNPTAISVDELRQWFMLPLPANVVDSIETAGGALITLRKTDSSPSTIYSELAAANASSVLLPSVVFHSWEKTFYAPESVNSFSDTRCDLRFSPKSDVENAKAREIPNIRLLVAKPNRPQSAACLPLRSWRLSDVSLDQLQVSVVSVRSDLNSSHSSPACLPKCVNDQLLLLVIKGRSKALLGSPSPHIGVQFLCERKAGTTVYSSPWPPLSIAAGQNWSDFQFAVPVSPTQLPGLVRAVRITTTNGDPSRNYIGLVSAPAAFAAKDMTLQVARLSNRPLAEGYSLF